MTSKKSLDDAIAEIRQDKLDTDQISEASGRVWRRISQQLPEEETTPLRNCDDIQSLIPSYVGGRLAEARALLLEDHTRECVVCRKALEKARSGKVVQASFRPRTDRTSFWLRWGSIAAALPIGLGLFQMGVFENIVPWETEAVAVLQQSDGTVFQVLEEGTVSIGVKQEIRSRQSVRTAKGSGAVLELSDGSQVELAPRTELAIVNGWLGTTIQLRRGNVIVEAATQDSGQLYVSTDECRVAVKGTVFSVSHGMKGSRVSVFEGEVLVEKNGLNTTLKPGEQFASQPSLSRVSVEEDIAWSQCAEDHLALLHEFSAIQKDLHEATFGEHLRYSSELLDLLPVGTVAYGAIPNVSGQLGDVYQLFMQRLQENAALREWYEERFFPGDRAVTLDDIVEKLTRLGDYLGEEIVFAIVQPTQGEAAPVVLSRVTDESRLWTMANEEAERINAEAEGEAGIFIIDDPVSVEPAKGLFVLIDDGLVAASPSLELLESVVDGSPGAFAESSFYQRIFANYSEGVDWLLSLDLDAMAQNRFQNRAAAMLEKIGLTELHDLVVQRKRNEEGVAENHAVVSYESEDEDGMISWIANPGPIGGMEYVSPEAYLAAAFVINDPSKVVESLMHHLEQEDSAAIAALSQFESEHNISILDDIAAPLGGEIVFAVDGPVLPNPSWKVIVEVYDPLTLQRTIEDVIDEVNQIVLSEGDIGVELLKDVSGGMTVYSLSKSGSQASIEYAYANGYMIIAPDRSLIYSAKQFQEARYTLVTSPDFMRSLPRDGNVNLSAVFYQNLAPMLDAVISSPVGQSLSNISPEAGDSVKELLGDAAPMLVTLSAEPGQLTLASGGDLESFWMNLGTLASLGGPKGIAEILRGGLQVQ